jgi:hypothetical protein
VSPEIEFCFRSVLIRTVESLGLYTSSDTVTEHVYSYINVWDFINLYFSRTWTLVIVLYWQFRLQFVRHTRVHPKVSGLAAWNENCKRYGSLPLGAVVSHFVSQSSEFRRHNPFWCFSTSVYCCKRIYRYLLSPKTFGYTFVAHSTTNQHCDTQIVFSTSLNIWMTPNVTTLFHWPDLAPTIVRHFTMH